MHSKPSSSIRNTLIFVTFFKSKTAGSTDKYVCTPVEHQISRRSLRNASLVSIPEVDEAIATPSPRKRKLEYTFLDESLCKSTRKSVSFGPFLSPEFFDKKLPPSTPIKAGVLPGGIRRSLPAYTVKPSPEQSSAECSVLTEPEVVSSTEDEDTNEEGIQDTDDEGTTEGEGTQVFEDEGTQGSEDEGTQGSEDEGTQGSEDEGAQDTNDEDAQDTEGVEVDAHSTLSDDQACEETSMEYSMTGFEEEEGDTSSLQVEGGKDDEHFEGEDSGMRPGASKGLPTPLRRGIQAKPMLRKTKRAIPFPLKNEIEAKPKLRKGTKRSLPTPIRAQIQANPVFLKTRRAIPTPLSRAIRMKPVLRKTKLMLSTPLRKAILQKPSLKRIRNRSIPTPVRKEIETKPSLKKTKQSMPTPVRKGIETQPSLKKTKRSMPTPVRKDIETQPSLKKTKRSMPTPVRKDIETQPSLKKTKQSMPTPVRKDIETQPSLKKTKRSMPTPVRKDIETQPSLKKTKRSMPTPVRKDIETQPSLKKTKRSMPTPVRKDIETQPSLKKTKRSMPTPVRKDIETQPSLKKTKRSMPTPVRKDIETQPSLKKTKRSMPTPVRKDIETKPSLKKTKRSMPTPVRKDIETQPSLKKTKRSMPTPVRKDIETQPSLKKTKRSMPTPVRKDIETKPSLKKTKRSMPTPVRKDIETKPSLKKTKRSMPIGLQEAIQAGSVLHTNKKSLPSDIRNAIENQPALRTTKRSLPAAIREGIVQGVKLKATKKRMPSLLQAQIISKPLLRQTKSSLPSPLRAHIQSGVNLKKTKLSMPVELRKGIEGGTAVLKHVSPKVPRSVAKSAPPQKLTAPLLPAVKQARKRVIGATDEAGETPLPAPPPKKRRVADPSSPLPFSFDQFAKGASGSVDLSGIHVLHPNSKVEFSASHAETSLAKPLSPATVCSQPEVGTSLFQLGIDDKPTRPNGVRATRSRPTTDARSRSTRAKQKIASTDAGTAAKRVTRLSVRQTSDHTSGDNEVKNVTIEQTASAPDDVRSKRKKATRNTSSSKTIGKILLEAIPEEPSPSAVTEESDNTCGIQKQKQISSHKLSKFEETVRGQEGSMTQDRPKRSMRSSKHDEPVSVTVTQSEPHVIPPSDGLEVDSGNSKPRRVTRSLKQILVTPVKPHISTVASAPETKLPEPAASSFEPKKTNRSSRKAETAICLPQDYIGQDVSLQGPHDKKRLKVEQKSDASVDELPKKVTRSSKQTKAAAKVLPQEITSAIEQAADIPMTISDQKRGTHRIEQNTNASDSRKTRRATKSSKQDGSGGEQSTYALEAPPDSKKCKVEQSSNGKSARNTRSFKQVDTPEGDNVALEPMSTRNKIGRSSKPSQTVIQQERLVEPSIDETIPKRATRSSKLK